MSPKILFIMVLVIFSYNLFGQIVSHESNLLQEGDDEIHQSSIFLDADIGEIEDLNFRKRRFANWSFYTEFGGIVADNTYPHFSANLDAIIESKEKHMFTGRFGAGVILNKDGVDIFIPGYLAFLFGYDFHLELGAGANFLMSSDQSSQVVPAGIIGFRKQHPRGGLLFGANINLAFPQREITDNTTDYVLEPWISLRVGYCW